MELGGVTFINLGMSLDKNGEVLRWDLVNVIIILLFYSPTVNSLVGIGLVHFPFLVSRSSLLNKTSVFDRYQ